MSDIDDELLALAGGDVSSSEDEAPRHSRSGASSRRPSRSPAPASTSVKQSIEPVKKGVATRKVPAKKAAKRRPKMDESEEEGEA
jgi:RNA polymerase-associated protein RTF1